MCRSFVEDDVVFPSSVFGLQRLACILPVVVIRASLSRFMFVKKLHTQSAKKLAQTKLSGKGCLRGAVDNP